MVATYMIIPSTHTPMTEARIYSGLVLAILMAIERICKIATNGNNCNTPYGANVFRARFSDFFITKYIQTEKSRQSLVYQIKKTTNQNNHFINGFVNHTEIQFFNYFVNR